MASKTLYPPIVDTQMPAFSPIESSYCRIYFSLSQYNKETEIKGIQVIVNDQRKNSSVVDSAAYPMGIIRFTSLSKDKNGYYINLLKGKHVNYIIDSYYKVQIRFDDLAGDATEAPNASWVNNHLDNFSEWSTVCLIKPISLPKIELTNGWRSESAEQSILNSTTLTVAGGLIFVDSDEEDNYIKVLDEDETLRSYFMTLRKMSGSEGEGEIIETSGVKYVPANGPQNTFTYTFKTELEDQASYSVQINYTTRNLYQPSSETSFNFKVDLSETQATKVSILVFPDKDTGRNKIVLYDTQQLNAQKYYISRQDSTTNYTQWEDIHTINNIYQSKEDIILTSNDDIDKSVFEYVTENKQIIEDVFQYVWFDVTCELGMFYKYRVQEDVDGERTKPNYSEKIINDSDQVILTSNNMVLNATYNSSLGSMKHVIMESKTDTLGGIYPIIRRNGNVKYRTFSISGLVTLLSDEKEAFILKKDLYDNSDNMIDYIEYNKRNNISDYNNYILERRFRDKVIDFLEDGNPKLFKTLTEGNILVKLTDVSLSPQTQLHNYIYSFSANAIEIEQANINNYFKYNILKETGNEEFKYLATQAYEKILTENEQPIIVQEGK